MGVVLSEEVKTIPGSTSAITFYITWLGQIYMTFMTDDILLTPLHVLIQW